VLCVHILIYDSIIFQKADDICRIALHIAISGYMHGGNLMGPKADSNRNSCI